MSLPESEETTDANRIGTNSLRESRRLAYDRTISDEMDPAETARWLRAPEDIDLVLRKTKVGAPSSTYPVHIYKLRMLAMNGWRAPRDAELDLAQAFMIEEEPDTSTYNVAMARLDASIPLLVEMGLTYEGQINNDVWLAPLPAAGESAFVPSEYMVAVPGDDVTFLISPYELPWLKDGALDSRSAKLKPAEGM